ncbi:hypothetical protein BDB01DRAFT_809847 [Pilobolus umbonatus]|nr:hypothetical protein BDB01DRAFT_809847 [Pilobolus umbonatus]
MKALLLFIALLLINIHDVLTLLVDPLRRPSCTYLVDSIYCACDFGKTYGFASDMISLYVHNTTATQTKSIKFGWELITNRNDNMVKGRRWPQYIASPDHTKLFLQGGDSARGNALDNPFLVFNTSDNVWYPLPDFPQEGVLGSQIYQASVSYVSSINKLVYWGGLTLVPSITAVNRTIVGNYIMSDKDSYYLPYGFHRVTTFDIETQQWHEVFNETGQDTSYFYSSQNAISVPGSNSIYFLGGERRRKLNSSMVIPQEYYNMSELTLPEYQWTTHNLTGTIPTIHNHPTSTLMPDNKTVLLYGKDRDSVGALAYQQVCYLLDLETKVWRRCPIDAPDDIKIVREAHAAVLVQNHLFIIFGEFNKTVYDDILIFDVSDLNHIKYVDEYVYELSTETVPRELSGGKIAGISVACALVAVVSVAVLLYICKKKPFNSSGSVIDFPVDWDVIDRDFNESYHESRPCAINEAVNTSIKNDVVKPEEMHTSSVPKAKI